jgi:GT2 family glycosyltransferase
VPCHNYGAYLRECVESVLAQTFTAWELIIVNDGSTDDTFGRGPPGFSADHRVIVIRYE